MAEQEALSLVAVGDVGPLRENPGELFDLARPLLKGADITFGQLEKNLSERGTVQLTMPRSLGRTHPRVAKALAEAGFDVLSFASNHALDYSNEALLDTLDNLAGSGIKVIGAGRNIREARRPTVFERKGMKVGFLGYCSVVPRSHEAWEDKPGVAPVRASSFYEQVDWQPGTPPRIVTEARAEDLAAMEEDIRKLRPEVDVLVVSLHWGIHFVPAMLAGYQLQAGHAAVDAGADIVLGHHAHILKGIEVYKDKAIFYDLCNFGIDQPQSHMVKGELYRFYRFPIDPEYATYPFPVDAQKTIAVKCQIAGNKIERVAFQPAWINKKGQPELLSAADPRSEKVLEYMTWLCREQQFDTKFSREGDDIVVGL